MPRINDRIIAVGVVSLFAVTVFGCGKKDPAPPGTPKTMAGVKAPIQKKRSSVIAPPPQEKFDFSGKKDPFRSYMVATKSKLPLPSVTKNQLPIQKYDVNQFKVIGIITGLEENRAMVLDPTGKSHVIKAGSFIGPHNGRVQSIKPAVIEVVEQYREESGKIRNRVVTLTLPRKE